MQKMRQARIERVVKKMGRAAVKWAVRAQKWLLEKAKMGALINA
jgi:hypothetical protein